MLQYLPIPKNTYQRMTIIVTLGFWFTKRTLENFLYECGRSVFLRPQTVSFFPKKLKIRLSKKVRTKQSQKKYKEKITSFFLLMFLALCTFFLSCPLGHFRPLVTENCRVEPSFQEMVLRYPFHLFAKK